MKVVAGLGNPEEKYRDTRHNVGFEVINRIALRAQAAFDTGPAGALLARWRFDGSVVLLVKPLTFMNLSGGAIAATVRYYKVDVADLLIVCDDVNLPLGRLRLRADGSEGGHNGLKSVAGELGTTTYSRLRVGVGRGDNRVDLADHVLARFDADERPEIERAVERAADAVETWVSQGIASAMNTFNRATEDE